MPTQANPIKRAERYMARAHALLSEKAGRDGRLYSNRKYVKLAGNAAWKGVLVALDAVLDVKSDLKNDQLPYFKDYLAAATKKDEKIYALLLTAHDGLNYAMSGDGNLSYILSQTALSMGKDVIAWCEKIYTP
jgi:hypothetical protein